MASSCPVGYSVDVKLCGLQSWCGRFREKSVAHDQNRITNDSSAIQAVSSLVTTFTTLSRLYEIQKCLKEKKILTRDTHLTSSRQDNCEGSTRMCLQLPCRVGRYLDQMIGDKTRRLTLRCDVSSEILR